jgi:hypothetical protein
MIWPAGRTPERRDRTITRFDFQERKAVGFVDLFAGRSRRTDNSVMECLLVWM